MTALINNNLIDNVIKLTHSKDITEGIVIALEDYVYRKKIEQLIIDLENKPIEFQEGFSGESIRNLNRNNRLSNYASSN